MNNRLNVGVVGATGAVGEELLRIFEERNFPVRDLRLFASAASAGKTMEALGSTHVVREPSAKEFEGLDLVFFSAGARTAKEWAPVAVQAGARVIDNSSAFRMNATVPLVIPEINADALAEETTIASVPNCSAIILLVAVAPLRALGKIERIIVSTYQAASGAGAKAMRELVDQTREVLDGAEATARVFPHPIAFNLFSHNTAINENGLNEEEQKVVEESRKILGDPSLRVTPTCIRVPVLRAHSESVYIEFDNEVSEADARAALERANGVTVVDDRAANRFPMPRDASGKDDVLVGRIRRDLHNPCAINLFVSGDQLRKGAALNSVQIAEAMLGISKKETVTA